MDWDWGLMVRGKGKLPRLVRHIHFDPFHFLEPLGTPGWLTNAVSKLELSPWLLGKEDL